MWHEARKQERKIRGMLVDYRKRAERRRDFYEKIKADPTQFLQLHGRQCKIHLDPAVAAAADSPAAMMPWQGHADNLIDRFDVRAHLDFIPPIKKVEEDEATYEERQLNYERYRIIAQNSFLGITEEKFLKQLHLEEQFGYTETEPKKKKSGGAAIGFNYEDGTGTSQPAQVSQGNSSDEQSDSDLDVDLSINVSKMDSTQAHEMNRHGRNFGMSTNDFYSFLTNDLEEAENYRLAKEEEHEKALFSGRKSRRERRAHREKRLANRVISPPSYAARTSPTYPMFRESKSASKSPSPENSGKITYITSFGDDDEPASSSKPTYADKVKYGKSKKLTDNPGERRTVYIESTRKRSGSTEAERFSKRARSRSIEVKNMRNKSPNRYRSSHSRNHPRRYRSRRSSSSSSPSISRCRRRERSPSSSNFNSSKYKSRSRNRSSSRSRSSSRGRSRSPSKNIMRTVSRISSNPVPKSSSRNSSSSSDSRSPITANKSPSRSPSSTSKSSTSPDSSRSRSASAKKDSPPKVIPRYYGRRRSDQSSSDLSDGGGEDGKDGKPDTPVSVTMNKSSGNSGTATKKTSTTSLSLQERLKRKRQALLNKQFKADKIAEQLKTEREKQEQQNREDELREMAIKLRRRQRERRHAYDSNSSSSSDSEARARSPSISEGRRSKSPSPRGKRDDRDFKPRDSKYRYRDNSRERSRDREGSNGRRSPKLRHDSERRNVYRDDPERDKVYKRREEPSKESRRDRDRDSRDNRDSFKAKEAGISLVDY